MKKILIIMLAVAIMMIPVGVYAATSESEIARDFRGFCGWGDYNDLSDEEIAEWEAYHEDNYEAMIEARSAYYASLVESGLMTQDEADAEIAAMEEWMASDEYYSGHMMGGHMGIYIDSDDSVYIGRGCHR